MNVPPLGRYGQLVWTRFNEHLLNISTTDLRQWSEPAGWWRGPKTDRTQHADNHSYGTPDYYYVRKIVRLLNLGPQDVVYDIGSGMGRILCVLSREKVTKVVGIEVLEDLCEVARVNAAKVRGRRSPIEIRCQDASTAEISDGTIYFLFNPFGPETLRDLLNNIESSLSRNPRPLQIVYYNPTYPELLEARSWIRRHHSFTTLRGLQVHFYKSTEIPSVP